MVVDPNKPTITITQPVSGIVTDNSSLAVIGTVSGISGPCQRRAREDGQREEKKQGGDGLQLCGLLFKSDFYVFPALLHPQHDAVKGRVLGIGFG